jgi:hypothetical protein
LLKQQRLHASVLQYCVTIHWPTSWLATRGYTSFTLGFETRQEAVQWHTHVQKHVSSMRLRSCNAVSKAEVSASACHSSKPSYDDRTMQWSSGGTTITRKPSQVGAVEAAETPAYENGAVSVLHLGGIHRNGFVVAVVVFARSNSCCR